MHSVDNSTLKHFHFSESGILFFIFMFISLLIFGSVVNFDSSAFFFGIAHRDNPF